MRMNLTVDPGEVVGLIGRNGAGKTTLIKSLLGIVRTSDGTIELLGGTGLPATAAHERMVAPSQSWKRYLSPFPGL